MPSDPKTKSGKAAIEKAKAKKQVKKQTEAEKKLELFALELAENPTPATEVKDYGTMNDIFKDITLGELDLWSGNRRKVGKPSNAEIESFKRRNAKIVAIATRCTHSYSQTIRHIYYLCSGMGLVGKDHGKEVYWYDMVKFAVGEARWDGMLSWHRIADDSRPFNRPSFWDDDSDFLESVIPRFAMDKWKDQKTRVIVCVEKDAVMGMLSDLCRRYHVPIMSFHGQASDGGAVYTLANYIAALCGKCDSVCCYYLGDFDTCGCLIDRVTFGDPKSEEQYSIVGKVSRLLWQLTDYADNVPDIMYKRIGITPSDVKDPLYAAHLLASNDDSNFDRYVEDTNEVEDFPMLEGFTSKGAARGMVPATLGLDALDHVELIRRTKAAIKTQIDIDVWKAQRDSYKLHRAQLRNSIK